MRKRLSSALWTFGTYLRGLSERLTPAAYAQGGIVSPSAITYFGSTGCTISGNTISGNDKGVRYWSPGTE